MDMMVIIVIVRLHKYDQPSMKDLIADHFRA